MYHERAFVPANLQTWSGLQGWSGALGKTQTFALSFSLHLPLLFCFRDIHISTQVLTAKNINGLRN